MNLCWKTKGYFQIIIYIIIGQENSQIVLA